MAKLTNDEKHDAICKLAVHFFEKTGVKYTQLYEDDEDTTTYPSIYGRSIKFWHVFPQSGPRFDLLMCHANRKLAKYGFFLAHHVFHEKIVKTGKVVVPQKGNLPDVHCRGYYPAVDVGFSLIIKPLPEGCKPE